MRKLCHKWDHLGQKTDKVEIEWEKLVIGSVIFLDQRVDVRCELKRME